MRRERADSFCNIVSIRGEILGVVQTSESEDVVCDKWLSIWREPTSSILEDGW